ncbi:hypothetical protein [Pseudomonas sp. MWU13-2517]|uniref:hypothetical protein n=1 Tax=Pseudomonas sp. MWU13-2517 TaxID=2929055 RepID=UPI0020101EB5|nr:hypothetical protein [Pseudomonas sp. MWU13-2517]
MSKSYFEVDEDALQAAKARMVSGDAQILVLRDNTARFFTTGETIGYLSWTGILGEWPERIQTDYGHDVPAGLHTFPVAGFRRITYTDPDGTLFYEATAGEILLEVERPFGTEFTHRGILLNVRLESGDKKVALNGTFRCTSN